MDLQTLTRSLVLKKVIGDANIEITGLTTDSREVKPGYCFIAIRGFTVDGHRFIPQALERGAAVIVTEEEVDTESVVVRVPDTRRAMAVLAATYFRHPTRELKVIGITGTNGKTTTAHLIRRILMDAGKKAGLVGTIDMKIGEESFPVKNTTPDVVELQRSFRRMVDAGCSHAVIEVSSHALHQGRTWGIYCKTGVFTNLTQDHLDYHKTMEHYRASKGLLFSQLGNRVEDTATDQPLAVLNADDEASPYYSGITPAQVLTYGVEGAADVQAWDIRIDAGGTRFTLITPMGETAVHMKLMGKFSVYNALAATAAALGEGIPLEGIRRSLETIGGVDGRLEPVHAGQPFTVLVDYAHTPDSLQNVLSTVREFTRGSVLCVVGCGGDRDRGKRPIMAEIAARLSERVFITSDNPRTEDPDRIIADMLEGVSAFPKERVTVIRDRAEAISRAVQEAEPEDVVLIAGKGHETYQEIDGIRHDFDDRSVAWKAIQCFLKK
ncbi:UDP-N-acetylmuramoyl-L-alanyl-D-glutamate--2,6-diaminopimelate ligase [Desmospora profundinema]|uniref:UDP-N-acetylmuramoyl-L-alanyl-D-glutamate--2,6-diaminopimelate ligase n=1 Tax=Desmospora profundinema TaxID=1571184 RepID=A0ABU1ILH0_9BACL|nr:UDP-N-acetylmuramoyl-L-alanyl-D-glutamate--2,6-diaminopimelate ligase [Desmospora profundinema]MDR6224804.1 UDP-N-acetylmuramoyl-L-alanyl-D-glutamate--2,6-diaminopimelate ligase [Desmospora profundinema]